MGSPVPPDLRARVAGAAERHPDLSLLVLYGSRARGEARDDSDWDFAWLPKPGGSVDVDGLLADLVRAVGSDRIDLADLGRAGGLLRFQVARDGMALIDEPPGTFDIARIRAISFWCDVEPVLREAYAGLLAAL